MEVYLVVYNNNECRKDYAMPLIGNGTLSIRVGQSGTMLPSESMAAKNCLPTNYIWWAGRRYMDFFEKKLIPFGRFTEIFYDTDEWSQELDIQNGRIVSVCNYKFGKVISENFIHHDDNIVALRKTFMITEEKEYTFQYALDDSRYPDLYKKRVRNSITPSPNGAVVDYLADGHVEYHGRIRIVTDRKCNCNIENNSLSLSMKVKPRDAVCFYIIMNDDFECEDYKDKVDQLEKFVLDSDFESIYETHKSMWNKYMNEGYVNLPMQKENDVYKAAQYSLKCQTTKWSVPVGLCDTQWEAKFFAYDEYFGFLALLTSNHKSLAKRVPEFRNNGLDNAIKRATLGSPFHERHARYPWETIENGTETSPSGEWYDHIFHMSHIIMSACEYYYYTKDEKFLEECYEMIVCCSGFLLDHMVYTLEGGRVVIGKCTDLERMGPAKENAYQTTCSVIRALLYTADICRKFGDFEYSLKAGDTAKKLKENLPNDGEMYVPFPNAEISSIALFTGSFPYKVIEKNDKLQSNAIKYFEANEDKFGNCYAIGKGISTWYASYKAAAYAIMQKIDDALKSLEQAVMTTGCFGECYEINEPGLIHFRPWFTTAAAVYITAVNNMLLQKIGNDLYILPAFKCNGSVSFKLAVDDNTVVSVEIKDNCLISLDIISDIDNLNVILPEWLKDCRI